MVIGQWSLKLIRNVIIW